ncbi:hypothetical protein HFO97_27875 [Rhizobium leguminosarum]|uniref:hypothetical protein n=1 Tax=Rhizobium leguminosarum TaxID=384 RepID=UPI001C989F14|nr:hypothetical protein [Rhizobium leguminosarum]MBY5363693.1 hypothetical protein [Rhizobium leguminosarum]
MSNTYPVGSTISAWPSLEDVALCDAEILDDAISQMRFIKGAGVSSDVVYSALKEINSANDQWIKYYFIGIAILLLAFSPDSAEVTFLGLKISKEWLLPASVIYFCVCNTYYCTNELKMRLFRAYFRSLLKGRLGAERTSILLRYPLAYSGGAFIPREFRAAGYVIGLGQVLSFVPLAPFLVAGLFAQGLVYVLFGLAAYQTLENGQLPIYVQWGVPAAFAASVFLTATLLRPPNKKHKYLYEKTVQGSRVDI